MFSKILRRTHMYLALFLAPWVLMYTISTAEMNHRNLFPGGAPPFENAGQRKLTADVSTLPPAAAAQAILAELGMEGAHQLARPQPEGKLVILRHSALSPMRITYTPADRSAVLEKRTFRTTAFLEMMHRRRGWQHPYLLEDAWAFSVDLVIVVMVFWIVSGLWMWWELRVTRRLGALFLLGGMALFAFFLVKI